MSDKIRVTFQETEKSKPFQVTIFHNSHSIADLGELTTLKHIARQLSDNGWLKTEIVRIHEVEEEEAIAL